MNRLRIFMPKEISRFMSLVQSSWYFFRPSIVGFFFSNVFAVTCEQCFEDSKPVYSPPPESGLTCAAASPTIMTLFLTVSFMMPRGMFPAIMLVTTVC